MVIAVTMLLVGCSSVPQVLGTSAWTDVTVRFEPAATPKAKGGYTLVITQKKATLTRDGQTSAQKLPDGAWDGLTTAVRALGSRESKGCPSGQSITVTARAATTTAQSFVTTTCDGDQALAQAQKAVEAVLRLFG